jgi:hypothetical protein
LVSTSSYRLRSLCLSSRSPVKDLTFSSIPCGLSRVAAAVPRQGWPLKLLVHRSVYKLVPTLLAHQLHAVHHQSSRQR